MKDLTPLLAPRSVAVIGASADAAKSGGILFKNIKDGGFEGPLYPVNPRAATVQGLKAYPSVAALPEAVDLAYIVLPRERVAQALAECAEKGVGAACIIAAGFGESDDWGRAAEAELKAIVARSGIVVAGPNTVGLVNAERRLMGSFVPFPTWQDGGVALFGQSGLFAGVYILQVMSQDAQRLGVRLSLAVGNKIDVDEVDFLAFAAADAKTRVIGLYLESLRRPRAFLDLAREVRERKPIVVLKSGRTREGARASASHTGALATDDALLDAALRQHGIVRATDEDDFVDCLKALSMLAPPKGRRVAVLTTSGAVGVLMTDQLSEAGLALADFAPPTLEKLRSVLPAWQPASNPYDFWVAIDFVDHRAAHEIPLEAALSDPGVDMVLALLLAVPNADFEGFREVFASLRARHPGKPLALVIHGGAGVRDRWLADLEGLNVPVFRSSSAAVRGLRALAVAAHGGNWRG